MVWDTYSRWSEFLNSEKELVEDQQQCKLDQHFQTGNVYKADHSEQRCLVKSIALNLVVDCDLPVNIVSRPGFISHHAVTNRMYNSVDRFVMQMWNGKYYITILKSVSIVFPLILHPKISFSY